MTPEKQKELADTIAASVGAAVAPLKAELETLKAAKQAPTQHAAGIPEAGASKGNTKAARVKEQRARFVEQDRLKGVGLDLAAVLRFHTLAHFVGGTPEMHAEKAGYVELAEMMAAHRKAATSATDVSSGGALIPPQLSDEVIPLLVADAVMMKLGIRGLPMPSGAMSIPRQTSGATVSYVGENSAPAISVPGTDLVNLSYKKLMAVVVMSNDLLKFGGPKVDAWIRDRLVIDASLKFDLSALRGTGAANEISGVKTLMASGNVYTVTNSTTPSLAQVDADLYAILGKLEDANVQDDGTIAWVMPKRVKRYLSQLRDGVGQYIYRDELQAGELLGHKVGFSNQIPLNLGSGTETEIYLVKASDVYYGVANELEITFDPNGTYDDSGTARSGFSLDQSPIRAIARHDVKLAHPQSAAMGNVVKWGA